MSRRSLSLNRQRSAKQLHNNAEENVASVKGEEGTKDDATRAAFDQLYSISLGSLCLDQRLKDTSTRLRLYLVDFDLRFLLHAKSILPDLVQIEVNQMLHNLTDAAEGAPRASPTTSRNAPDRLATAHNSQIWSAISFKKCGS